MLTTMPIPRIDPVPVPGPLWLMRTLLLLTFFLHLLLMNTLLGGTAIAIVCHLRRGRSQFAAQLAAEMGRLLPYVFAFTVTLGVAPLLFVQVLYGNLLYASSILLAVPWFSVIVLVILAYYGLYYFSLRGTIHPARGSVVLLAVVLLLAWIAHVYTNNMTLMLAPERWIGLYRHAPGGWNLNWGDPTVAPRYLHFLVGAVAVAGLFLAIQGLRKRKTAYGRWLLEQGSLLFVAATMVNYAIGFWFLARLSHNVQLMFMGGSGFAAVLLGLGMLLPLAAIVHLVLAKQNKAPVRQASIGIGAGLLTVAVMVLMRDMVRNAYLAPHFQIQALPVAPQWGVIVLFLVLFVAGLATLFYMLRAVAQASNPMSASRAGSGE